MSSQFHKQEGHGYPTAQMRMVRLRERRRLILGHRANEKDTGDLNLDLPQIPTSFHPALSQATSCAFARDSHFLIHPFEKLH